LPPAEIQTTEIRRIGDKALRFQHFRGFAVGQRDERMFARGSLKIQTKAQISNNSDG